MLRIHTSIPQWRGKSFVQRHRIRRDSSQGGDSDADEIMECEEVRIFAGRREDGGIRALPIPQDIRKLCE